MARIPWKAPSPMAVSLAYENGLWGNSFEQGLRLRIPLHPNWGVLVRPLALQNVNGDAYTADLGGRFELYGASPVFLNFARIYGGGGVHVLDAVSGVGSPKPVVGGGGHFGFEFFFTPTASFSIEIGGTSGAQGNLGAGGTAVAGMTWYPFASSGAAPQVAAMAL
jgi:hypothetical protein